MDINLERFASYFSAATPTDCWEWQAGKTQGGYGLYRAPGRSTTSAHRVAYEWVFGPIPAKYDVDHLCRNRACVNPLHLEAITHSENIRRSWAHKREMAQAINA